ncbi:unnamed protein product, partial [Scytosiphon promiscuus]
TVALGLRGANYYSNIRRARASLVVRLAAQRFRVQFTPSCGEWELEKSPRRECMRFIKKLPLVEQRTGSLSPSLCLSGTALSKEPLQPSPTGAKKKHMDGSEDDVEDGEIHEGFLGQAEMENRKTLANAYGEDAQMSWVEAVLLGAKHVAPTDSADAAAPDADNAEKHHLGEEPPPPGTAADRPPPGAAAIARLEAALVHRITALLDGGGDTHGGGEGRHDAAGAVVEALAEAASDGVDVARWLGHGRSSLRGRTPLMEAGRRNQTGCCARLAELACAHGVGLNAGNDMEGRNSALHYACYEGACGSVCELLVRGADPRLRNKEGETALQAALANGQTECADLVRDFLRRPTFEPDPQSGAILSAAAPAAEPPPPPPSPPSNAAVTPLRSVPSTRPSKGDKTVRDGDSGSGGVSGADRSGGGSSSSAGDSATAHGGSGGSGIGAAAIGGVTGVAPEVCRANAVFCLGRGRRRLGDRVRPGRGLGVGVGTAAAEVGLGARRVAQLHSTNPCSGTAMEAFVLWSIASGQDPFQSEFGEVGGGERAARGGFDEEEGEHLRRKGRGRRWRRRRERGGGNSDGTPAGVVWLEHYVRVYNASLRRWYGQQESHHSSTQQLRGAEGYRATPAAAGERLRRAPSGLEMGLTGGAAAGTVATENSIGGGGGVGDGSDGFGAGPPREGSTYALVVKESKALAVGRRFEIPHGADLVIGRSQSLAGIVVKDELVSKSHLRIVNSDNAGVRVSDLGSKHGAVITKPAPASSTGVPPPIGSTQPPLAGGKADGQPGAGGGRGGAAAARPAGLGGKDPPAAPKQKFFPIPIPRAPEWVAGAHGDRISLGKTVLVLEREGGPEPPTTAAQRRRYLRQRPGGGVVEVAVDGSGGVGAGAGAVAAGAAARGKAAPAVISKGFAANPNLMNAIRTAEEAERRRKRAAAESELAAQAAAQYLSNKRARSTAASPAGSTAPPASAAGSRVGVAARVGTTASAAAAASAPPEVGVVAEDERRRESSSFDHVSKGSMLLRRMGWKEGTGLGRRSDGNLQPVQVTAQKSTS